MLSSRQGQNMEKRKAHYNLETIRQLIINGNFVFTRISVKNARDDFGIIYENQILEHILELEVSDFYKSMTSNYDNSIWQDVYHKKISEKTAYIKLQLIREKTVIVQFKEK